MLPHPVVISQPIWRKGVSSSGTSGGLRSHGHKRMSPPNLLVISQIELIYMHTRSPHLQLALASGSRSRKDPRQRQDRHYGGITVTLTSYTHLRSKWTSIDWTATLAAEQSTLVI